jgi:beta-aspartyl-peptidase (threonine type)
MLAAVGGHGGAIVLSHDGRIAMPFNSTGLYRAWLREGEALRTAIYAA